MANISLVSAQSCTGPSTGLVQKIKDFFASVLPSKVHPHISQFFDRSVSIWGTEPLLAAKEGYGSHKLTGPSARPDGMH